MANFNKLSRYKIGGDVDINGRFLGWWRRARFEKSFDDIEIVIDGRTEFRPDIIAFENYQTSRLAWFILQYNNIADVTELTEGTKIKIPTPQRLFSEIF